jgi:hypothetical protein
LAGRPLQKSKSKMLLSTRIGRDFFPPSKLIAIIPLFLKKQAPRKLVGICKAKHSNVLYLKYSELFERLILE